jgi:hypothetical protein
VEQEEIEPVEGVADELFNLSAPSAQADWKAWEEYEKRLIQFLGDGEGSFTDLLSKGFTFANEADIIALKAAWDVHKAIWSSEGKDGPTKNPSSTWFTSVTLEAPKTSNVKGKDVPKIHDWSNNAELFAEGSSSKGPLTNTKLAYLLPKIEISGIKLGREAIEGQDAVLEYASQDGEDLITDFQLQKGDSLLFQGVESEAEFISNFVVIKHENGHRLTIAIDNDGDDIADAGAWSLTVVLHGLDGSEGVNGKFYKDLEGEELESFIWNYMIDQGPGYTALAPIFQDHISADYQSYLSDYIIV